MNRQQAHPGEAQSMRRRDLLKAGLVAGVTLSALPLHSPSALWGAEAGQPRRGGILRVRGYDPPHFDHHLTLNFKTNSTLSFAYSTLVRYKVGADVRPGPSRSSPTLPNGGSSLMTQRTSSICARASNGITNHPSMDASW